VSPGLFWSLDSDILPAPDALSQAMQALGGSACAAMGMRTFMTPSGTAHASKADLVDGRLVNRGDVPYGTHAVDVIMGSKLMTGGAYRVDYEFDRLGEDVGWSSAVKRTGAALGWCGTASCKHVMAQSSLGEVDSRVGF